MAKTTAVIRSSITCDMRMPGNRLEACWPILISSFTYYHEFCSVLRRDSFKTSQWLLSWDRSEEGESKSHGRWRHYIAGTVYQLRPWKLYYNKERWGVQIQRLSRHRGLSVRKTTEWILEAAEAERIMHGLMKQRALSWIGHLLSIRRMEIEWEWCYRSGHVMLVKRGSRGVVASWTEQPRFYLPRSNSIICSMRRVEIGAQRTFVERTARFGEILSFFGLH